MNQDDHELLLEDLRLIRITGMSSHCPQNYIVSLLNLESSHCRESQSSIHSLVTRQAARNPLLAVCIASWWCLATQLKNMIVKLAHFPNFRGENEKYLKPPPRLLVENNPGFPGNPLAFPGPSHLVSGSASRSFKI